MNTNSIYLAGSNQQLILTNATNSLSRTVGPAYASTLTATTGIGGGTINGPNQQITVYELRKSKRLASGGAAAPGTGTIRTATYVSPNGTLSRVNILTDGHNGATIIGAAGGNSGGATPGATLDVSELKQAQIANLQNPRNLGQLIGFGGSHTQPNDYCASGKIGAIILDDNGTIKSSVSSSHRNGHYLIPLNTNRGDMGDGVVGESLSEQQHLYFQHMAHNTYVPSAGGHANVNFNYSSSDTENDSSGSNGGGAVATTSQLVSAGFAHMGPYTMSKRQVYTTNSFGRQPAPSSTSAAPIQTFQSKKSFFF